MTLARLQRIYQILYLNVAYGMVKTTIKYVHDHDRREIPVEANITVPSASAEIVQVVEQAFEANPAVKIASFSHITSIPGE